MGTCHKIVSSNVYFRSFDKFVSYVASRCHRRFYLGISSYPLRINIIFAAIIMRSKILKDPKQTEFIGVMRPQTGVIAEAERLYQSLAKMSITQNYVVLNCFTSKSIVPGDKFPGAKVVCMPMLPRSIEPIEQIKGAANYLF